MKCNSNAKETSLAEICHQITDGKHGDCQNEAGSGYYFLSCKDVRNGLLNYTGAREITEADFRETDRRTKLEPGDILITNSGTIGRMALANNSVLTRRTTFQKSVGIIKPNSEEVFGPWLYYYLQGEVERLIAFAGGTAQKNLLLRDMRAFRVIVPPLPAQQRIASILSAYDDLIENNTRRIAILEEMARRLYEEWFVHFRFPGHERTEFEKLPISDVAEVVRGRSYKSSELVTEGGRPFVNLKCVNRDGGFRRDGLKRYEGRFKEQQLVSSGDIVMAVTDMTQERRIVARAALVPELGDVEGLISMDLVRIVPKPPTTAVFLYAALRWSDFAENVKNHATGANVLHLHPDRISEYLMPLPPEDYQQRYSSLAAPFLQEIEILEQMSENLSAQRDLLLPKLVSGEIDVSEAGRALEAAE